MNVKGDTEFLCDSDWVAVPITQAILQTSTSMDDERKTKTTKRKVNKKVQPSHKQETRKKVERAFAQIKDLLKNDTTLDAEDAQHYSNLLKAYAHELETRAKRKQEDVLNADECQICHKKNMAIVTVYWCGCEIHGVCENHANKIFQESSQTHKFQCPNCGNPVDEYKITGPEHGSRNMDSRGLPF